MPRALVTGGAGFIGSHVADLYLENGYDVTILDNFASGRRENVPAACPPRRVGPHERRSREPRARWEVLTSSRTSARRSTCEKASPNPTFDATVNVVGTVNLVEAVRASGDPTRFIFSSTGGALYGDFVTPPNVEDYPKDPESPYGIAKLSAELYLAYYARVHGVDTVALRYANVYGPRQDPHGEAGVVAIFCNRILTRQPLTVFGDGSQTRDYVFVKDVARAQPGCRDAHAACAGPPRRARIQHWHRRRDVRRRSRGGPAAQRRLRRPVHRAGAAGRAAAFRRQHREGAA